MIVKQEKVKKERRTNEYQKQIFTCSSIRVAGIGDRNHSRNRFLGHTLMKVGTKSVLFGAHAFWLHPFIVAIGWLKLYGLKKVRCPHSKISTSILDPRLWIVFFVHDLGYWGKPNMDGPEGELHPLLGARICSNLFDSSWHYFTLYHSRFLAKRDNVQPSIFCAADKMAIAIEPSWLYIPRTQLSGELALYMHVKPREIKGYGKSARQWHKECRNYCRAWAIEHKDGRTDSWTPKE